MRTPTLAILSAALLVAAGGGVALQASAAPAKASAKASDKSSGDGGEVDERELARSIDLGGLVFPVFDEKRNLKNYIFVNARMRVADGKDTWAYREKAHFIRDAVIRAAHRTSFGSPKDARRLNEQLAREACLKAANEALGQGNVLIAMTFTQIDSQSND